MIFFQANNYSNKNHTDKSGERRERESEKALCIFRRPITFCSSLFFYQFPTFRTRHLQRLCLFISSQTASNVRQAFEENAPKSEKEIENESKNISAHFTFHLFIWKMSTTDSWFTLVLYKKHFAVTSMRTRLFIYVQADRIFSDFGSGRHLYAWNLGWRFFSCLKINHLVCLQGINKSVFI